MKKQKSRDYWIKRAEKNDKIAKKEEDNKNVSKSQPSTQSEYYNINEIDDMNIPVIHSEVKQETKMYTNV